MRSLTLKAALAAVLVTTPLASAFARDHHPASGASSSQISRSGIGALNGMAGEGDSSDSSKPISGQPQLQRMYPVNVILGELHSDDARIAADRKMRLVTPAQARALTGEDAAIRRAALNDAAGRGVVSSSQYNQLTAEVSNLDSQIARDSGRG